MYLPLLNIATIGGFIVGTALGWTAPAGPMMENNQYSFVVSNESLAWIGACMPLGAMLGCPVTAGLVDKWGRKNMMLMLCIPTLVGWAMIIWAESVSTSNYMETFVFALYTKLILLGDMDLCWQTFDRIRHWFIVYYCATVHF